MTALPDAAFAHPSDLRVTHRSSQPDGDNDGPM